MGDTTSTAAPPPEQLSSSTGAGYGYYNFDTPDIGNGGGGTGIGSSAFEAFDTGIDKNKKYWEELKEPFKRETGFDLNYDDATGTYFVIVNGFKYYETTVRPSVVPDRGHAYALFEESYHKEMLMYTDRVKRQGTDTGGGGGNFLQGLLNRNSTTSSITSHGTQLSG